MTYVIEKLDASAKEKILADSACNVELNKRIKYSVCDASESVNWIIDRYKNSYFFKLPAMIRDDDDRRAYLFYFEKIPYVLYLKGLFGTTVFFEDFCAPTPSVREAVQAGIAEAFSVYGEFGEGPLNKDGRPEFSIIPSFG